MVLFQVKCKICGEIISANGHRMLNEAIETHITNSMDDLHRNAYLIMRKQQKRFQEALIALYEKYPLNEFCDFYEVV